MIDQTWCAEGGKSMRNPSRPFSSSWRDMAHVPRWAILRKNRQQNLAEHCYYVAVYADQVARIIGWEGNYATLMRYALYHDLDETITGDIPGPAKRLAWDKKRAEDALSGVMTAKYGQDVVDARDEAPEAVRAIVSVADSIDEVCYLSEEVMSGNVWVKTVLNEAFDRLKTRWMNLPTDPDQLDDLWKVMPYRVITEQQMSPVLLEDVL